MKLSPEEAEAFARLRNTHVEKVVERELEGLKDTLISAQDGTRVRQVQGAAVQLREILSAIHATPGKRQ
jgi:uncharacterized protein with FMN-binding domain